MVAGVGKGFDNIHQIVLGNVLAIRMAAARVWPGVGHADGAAVVSVLAGELILVYEALRSHGGGDRDYRGEHGEMRMTLTKTISIREVRYQDEEAKQ